jgi:DNA-binding NarL/FixJ family response regulator
MSLRVLIAVDLALYRDAMTAALEQEGFEVVEPISDGRDTVVRCRQLQPDIALLDIAMLHISALEAAREIVKVCPKTRVVILGEKATDGYVVQSLQAGAKGYLVKTDSAAELARGLHLVAKGETYITRSAGAAVQQQQNGIELANALGARERQVLRLIAEGKKTEEIAGILDISYQTVRSHRKHIMEKLGVCNTAGLVRYSVNSA